MNINPCAEYTAEVADMLRDAQPVDYAADGLQADVEAGRTFVMTATDDNGTVRLALAYRVTVIGERTELEVVALNAKPAPVMLRAAWAALEGKAKAAGRARISAMIETDGMASFVERLGMQVRAALYVKDFS